MKNLKALATELTANKMTLLVATDMLHIKGGCGCTGGSQKVKSFKIKSYKTKSIKSGGGSNKGGYGCGTVSTWAYVG
jgi:uncharacterized membrane protein